MTSCRAATPWVAALILLTMVIAIYGPGIGKGFVKDDVVWVGTNHVTSWTDVRALLFRTDGFYRPVVAMTFALDRAVYGLAPFGFGVTNLILLLLGACALVYLATSLGLPLTTAVVVAGVWMLNFHAVNMAVLWLSGRTALCVVVAALLAAAAVVRDRPIVAGVATLVAMLAKEEAVMLPFILSGWACVLAGDRSPTRVSLIRLTWPTWIALAIYFALRMQTAAMTPLTAPDAYRFVLSPGALVGNALEYLDRACSFSAIVLVVAHVIAWRRPVTSPAITRVLLLAAIWFLGTFALTVFVPNRSSLYALLPSIAPALATGFLLQQLWDGLQPAVHRRLIAAAVIVPVLLLPVYWSRNQRWVEIAELSTETFGAIQRVARERPDADRLVFRDDRRSRRSLANAYDQLLPEAVRLAAG
ncbi:MAG TPA: hypothetical protein VKA59_22090, partial [Vicinamibacterales bacterium]|nr:hypothetical protein [Vicinamibacterales bacterium]